MFEDTSHPPVPVREVRARRGVPNGPFARSDVENSGACETRRG